MRTLADGLPDAIPGDVRRAFHRIDENKSGQLDYRELRAALKELGLRSDTGEAVRLLQEYDRSGDGLLSLHEFGGLVRQLYLPDISPISQLYLPYFSTSSPLYLPYISPISPLLGAPARRRRGGAPGRGRGGRVGGGAGRAAWLDALPEHAPAAAAPG